MAPNREKTEIVTVEITTATLRQLEKLTSPANPTVADVLESLAAYAAEGVEMNGAPSRDWVLQVFDLPLTV